MVGSSLRRWWGQPYPRRHYAHAVSITEDAPAAATGETVRAWWWLVAASGLVLVLVAAVVTVWWGASRETRTTSYRVLGDLAGVDLDLGDADVQIDGGGGAVEVRRVDRFSFGHPSEERRSVRDGVLSVVSRCPDQVLGACRTAYRLTVPDNVPVRLETSSGSVRLTGVRASVQVSTGSGAIASSGFCGHSLRAVSDSGNVSAAADCSVEQFVLRSRSGDVRAVVPAGRYRVDAQSDSGRRRVRGVTAADDAPFQVQALSTSGDVAVDGAAS
jgi:hypothetical protein